MPRINHAWDRGSHGFFREGQELNERIQVIIGDFPFSFNGAETVPSVYNALPQYHYHEIIHTYTEGDVSREKDVELKDVDDFYLWLAFKNLQGAKEKYLIEKKHG